MGVDILAKGLFLNEPLQKVQTSLGIWDGFIWNDHVPAYILEDGRANKTTSWQIVFWPDQQNTIRKITITENR